MEILFTGEGIIALLTLTILEIVLGIDNIIFISILVGKLPASEQQRARLIGLSLALILRLVFLFFAVWIASLTMPLFTVSPILLMQEPFGVSGRDLIMFGGGMFLLAKATTELYNKLEGPEESHEGGKQARRNFAMLILQIIVLDIVFSIDSVITAVGLTQNFPIMAIAVIVAVAVMMLSAKGISSFIDQHPSVKILALAFLLMIGMLLVIDGFHVHVPKGYVYFAMAFSVLVEMLNLRFRTKKGKAVELRKPEFE
ncbi:MAG: TerC family protein [Ignavibacteriae bacterium]|nr:MAG: TerC family protein [Ignavibacteriota bacterium]